MSRASQDLYDRTFKDANGHYALWQTPNIWLISWVVITFVSLFFNGKLADVLTVVGAVALIIWSVLEITKGANYFRRLLGVVVLILSIMALVKAL